MTPLFIVVLAIASAVIAGLGIALRALHRRAREEAVDRALFDDFDAALARRPER